MSLIRVVWDVKKSELFMIELLMRFELFIDLFFVLNDKCQYLIC